MAEDPELERRSREEFAHRAEDAPPGFFREFYDFLIDNRKWWLAPIIVVLLLLSVLIVLTGTPLAPFIYSFF